jgi:hypothetical protein
MKVILDNKKKIASVGEVVFVHRIDKNREYFEHVDDKAWAWVIQRYNRGDQHGGWVAFVSKAGKYAPVQTINCVMKLSDKVHLGRLSSIDFHDYVALLIGMTKLILADKWPEDIVMDQDKYEELGGEYE